MSLTMRCGRLKDEERPGKAADSRLMRMTHRRSSDGVGWRTCNADRVGTRVHPADVLLDTSGFFPGASIRVGVVSVNGIAY